ncbi:MAG: hypothetical protein REI78_15390 [Pedobacter sp.]|nr:hypothetical protein [Pedobacter sp.]MDQ8054415.1 hypothetical protein [Pedobacter sp.]
MKNIIYFFLMVLFLKTNPVLANLNAANSSFDDSFTTSVTFPANFVIGDYIEFVKVSPISVQASGYYQISISYTRNNMAAAATHVAAISHANFSLWKETGRINNNKYVDESLNFTIDCNGESGNPKFRVRAIAALGGNSDLTVQIKVTSININDTFTAIHNTGNDINVNKFQPMTNDWDLYVGNIRSSESAIIAIKALQNGNISIGTISPSEKLSVNGKIRAKEIKVETTNWPDYVFDDAYSNKSLPELEQFIKNNKHLPEVPLAKEVEQNGIELGEMNKILLKKIEELTLLLIEHHKKIEQQDELIKKI